MPRNLRSPIQPTLARPMKPSSMLVLTILIGSLARVCSGQGTVLFANRVPAVVDAAVLWPPIWPFGFEAPRMESRFVAQLYAAPVGGTLQPVGDPVPFVEGRGFGPGYFAPVERQIPGVPPGQPAQVKMVAWYRGLGRTYAEALMKGAGGIGESGTLMVAGLGGGNVPAPPLVGLQGFTIGLSLGYDPSIRPFTAQGFPPDPASITRWFDFVPTLEWPTGLAMTGTRGVLSAGHGGLQVVDFSNPGKPVRLGSLLLQEGLASALALRGDRAYVGLRPPGGPGGMLREVDVSNPAQPMAGSGVELSGSPQVIALTEDGRHALVGMFPGGLQVVALEGPDGVRSVGRYGTGEGTGIAVVGTRVFLAAGESGLHILDLTNPAQPTRLGVFAPEGRVQDVAVRGALAFVTRGFLGGLDVIDVSDPGSPRRLAQIPLQGGGGSILMGERHLYVQNFSSNAGFQAGGVSVVDISDPAFPRVVGRAGLGSNGRPVGRVGDRLLLADMVSLTTVPLGPRLSLGKNAPLLITGTLGQPYEIQGWSPERPGTDWSLVTKLTGTGLSQVVGEQRPSELSSWIYRAVTVPR